MTEKSVLSPVYSHFVLVILQVTNLKISQKILHKTLKNGQNWAKNGPEILENGNKKWLDTMCYTFLFNFTRVHVR